MMDRTTSRRSDRITTVIGGLAVVEGISFLLGALLHLEVDIPLGFTVLEEPRIIPAVIVEGLCGLALLAGAYGVLSGRSWGRMGLIDAHVFAMAGVLLGITALAVGAGPRTQLNDIYHLVILTTLGAGLAVLLLAPRIWGEEMH